MVCCAGSRIAHPGPRAFLTHVAFCNMAVSFDQDAVGRWRCRCDVDGFGRPLPLLPGNFVPSRLLSFGLGLICDSGNRGRLGLMSIPPALSLSLPAHSLQEHSLEILSHSVKLVSLGAWAQLLQPRCAEPRLLLLQHSTL